MPDIELASYQGQQEITEAINNLSLSSIPQKAVWFDNVASMVAYDLPVGVTAATRGYHTVNDGGNAFYYIREVAVGDVEDGGSIIFLDNGNVAELITDGSVNILQFGAKSDYVGNPNYDGNDTVTCTDNTNALKSALLCCKRKGVGLYIPAGHYGFTMGNIDVDFDTSDLSIFGDGAGISVLDYVKEDNTHDGEANPYVTEATANYLFSVASVNNIQFADITLKATTKRDHGVRKIYAGAVWGVIVTQANNIVCMNLEVSHFAYRGITIGSQNSSAVSVNSMELINCYGHDNSSTGFWANGLKVLYVNGGEYAYNGVNGENSSGYAFALSSYCEKMIVENCYFHNNYNKAIDGHSCCDAIIKGCIFRDNIAKDISLQGWNVNYSYGTSVNITDCDVYKGDSEEGEAFIKSAMQEFLTRGTYINATPAILQVADNTQGGSSAEIIKTINLVNFNVYGAYNATDILSGFNAMLDFNAADAELTIADCNWDFNKFIKGSEVSGQSDLIPCLVKVKQITMRNSYYNLPNQLHGGSYGGGFISLHNSFVYKFRFINCRFDAYDAFVLYYGGGSDTTPFYYTNDTEIFVDNVEVNYSNGFPPIMNNYMTIDASFGSTPHKIVKNYRINDVAHNRTIYPKHPASNASPFVATKNLVYSGSISADTDFFSVIVSSVATDMLLKVDLLELYGNNSVDTILVKVKWDWTYTISSAANRYTVSGISSFTDVDGITKYKITFKTLTSVTANNYIKTSMYAFGYNHGIEDIVSAT